MLGMYSDNKGIKSCGKFTQFLITLKRCFVQEITSTSSVEKHYLAESKYDSLDNKQFVWTECFEDFGRNACSKLTRRTLD